MAAETISRFARVLQLAAAERLRRHVRSCAVCSKLDRRNSIDYCPYRRGLERTHGAVNTEEFGRGTAWPDSKAESR